MASGPIPREPVHRNGAGIPPDYVPPPRSTGAIDQMPLNDPAPAYSSPPPAASYRGSSQGVSGFRPAASTTRPAANAGAKHATGVVAGHGETIEVQHGDTLFGISKKYKVSISELMTINNLQGPNLKPGQKLTLPAGKRPVQRQVAKAPSPAQGAPTAPPTAEPHHVPPLAAAPPPHRTHPLTPSPAPIAAADWNGTHTVAQGESLYGIALKHRIKAAELQAANGITDPTKVRPGTVLKVPGSGEAAAPAKHAATRTPTVTVQTQQVVPTPVGSTPSARIINGTGAQPADRQRYANLPANPETQTDAAPTASPAPAEEKAAIEPKIGATGKFRWPVKGKVIASYGPRSDSTRNDGINIAVPAGTDVAAAESGVVAYAGNDLKGYGNLVLVRHENNWVSAYAHNDAVLVKSGDKVKRGQVIAKAGASGSVDQPQVHFELRQGSKPVDPMPHMDRQ